MRRTRITDLNPHITCKLCNGYFVDATTIIECLHSFCRSCIVKYLKSNKYCPVCDVQVHKTKPFLNIRPDKILQDVVYKLVPRLLQSELQKRKEFWGSQAPQVSAPLPDPPSHLITADESISLILSYDNCKKSSRYLLCPAGVSMGHIRKLVRAKYGLTDDHRVDIYHNQECLDSGLTLMDVAYIGAWKRKAPIELTYKIYEQGATSVSKRLKLPPEGAPNNNNWKEVQLRISENGEMSITGIQDGEQVVSSNNNNYNNKMEAKKKDEGADESQQKKKKNGAGTVAPPTQTQKTVKNVLSTLNKVALSSGSSATTTTKITTTSTTTTISAPPVETVSNTKPILNSSSSSSKKPSSDELKKTVESTKRKLQEPVVPTEGPTAAKRDKPTILNHTVLDGVQNLSNNHPLKKHSVGNKATVNVTVSTTTKTTPRVTSGGPKPPTTSPCYMPKPVINIPKPSGSVATLKPEKPQKISPPTSSPAKIVKTKPSTPIGYKTLRDPPKSWNSQISKAKPAEGKNQNVDSAGKTGGKPAKFFKMRNNMPRYLGNPASGVKPMYQVHVSPEKEKMAAAESGNTAETIKKHSIVKIDPKTLKPISEKAPEMTSLMTSSLMTSSSSSSSSSATTSDLKINTSSVSIFNPLKLQHSPKGGRKSPKSPGKTVAPSGSVINKRDKLNIKFTPPNPFVPNLTSPTVSPNQFLYPPGHPGFPSYDPRVMAVYHNLLYGQRMAFPAGLSLELNQMKGGFEMPPAATSPNKMPLTTQVSHKIAMQNSTPSTSSSAAPSSRSTSCFKTPSQGAMLLKKTTGKESTNSKNEKSLEIAVEKLTQSRVKEIQISSEASQEKENKKLDEKERKVEVSESPKTSEKKSEAVAKTPDVVAVDEKKKPVIVIEAKKKEEPSEGAESKKDDVKTEAESKSPTTEIISETTPTPAAAAEETPPKTETKIEETK